MLGEVWKLSAAAIARRLDNIPKLGYATAASGGERACRESVAGKTERTYKIVLNQMIQCCPPPQERVGVPIPDVAAHHQGNGRRAHVIFGAAHAPAGVHDRRRQVESVHLLGKTYFQPGPGELPAAVRAGPYGWRYGHISTGAATAASRLYGTLTSARRPTCSRPYAARRSGRAGAPGAWTSCLSVCRFGLLPDGRAKAGRQAGLMEHDPKYCDVIVQRCSKGHFEIRHCRSSRPMV